MNLILYGPSGVGKSTVGRALAEKLGREFVDSDPLIEFRAGLAIPQIFAERGEAEFRRLESEVCAELTARDNLIIVPGAGALLDPANRTALERHGLIICLRAGPEELLNRIQNINRPLLAGDDPAERLHKLLDSRRALYDSFPTQIDTTGKAVSQVVAEIEALLQPRSLPVDAPGLQHEILLGYGLLDSVPAIVEGRLPAGPSLIVTDENIAPHLPSSLFPLPSSLLPAGEQHKNLDSIRTLYEGFLKHGLDRNGVVIAIGGGVIGDMAGFAAATFMRGVRWVNVPTTLLAMVDASLGGKTGVDLPQGKNLVGAFYPPSLVISDPLTLNTLPQAEYISGMAEVIKHGVIGDPELFISIEEAASLDAAASGDAAASPEAAHPVGMWASRPPLSIDQLQRAIEVKIRVVEADPFERGQRATLNLGHTIGHGVESASGYRLRHGEAVAIGLAAETWIAERMGLAEAGLRDRITNVVSQNGLPTRCPGLDPALIRAAMSSDKKKAGGKLKFALPKRIGEVAWGVEVDEGLLAEALKMATA
jgi:3-dehydroquinate synthase